jgi:transcriptional regulator with XRE-family HTH domain
MDIGDRLRVLRKVKKYSQDEIKKRTGLMSCYISRVENGYTVPGVQTLEKFAHPLGVPMYQLFYDGEELPKPPKRPPGEEFAWGNSGKQAVLLAKFRRLLSKTKPEYQRVLMILAQKMANVCQKDRSARRR